MVSAQEELSTNVSPPESKRLQGELTQPGRARALEIIAIRLFPRDI